MLDNLGLVQSASALKLKVNYRYIRMAFPAFDCRLLNYFADCRTGMAAIGEYLVYVKAIILNESHRVTDLKLGHDSESRNFVLYPYHQTS